MLRKDDCANFVRKQWFVLLLVAVFLAYSYFHLTKAQEIQFNMMGSLAKPVSDEIYLASYPVVANYSQLASFLAFSSSGPRNCKVCGEPITFWQGENDISFNPVNCGGNVSLVCDGRSLSFALASGVPVKETANASVSALVENKTAFITLSGNASSNGYRPVVFLVDGQRVASPLYFLNGSFSFTESFPLSPGEHMIQVFFAGEQIGKVQAGYSEPFHWEPLLTIVGVLALAVAYKQGSWFSRLFAPIILAVAALVVGFRLSPFGLEFTVPLSLFCAAALLVFRKAPAKPSIAIRSPKTSQNLLKEAFLFAVFFTLFIVAVNFLIGNIDIWGAYYFRHVETTLSQGTTDYFDSLSYLGRPFTYPPVFFEFSAQVVRSLQLSSFEPIRIQLDWLYEFLFTFTAYLLFRSYSFSQRLTAALVFVSHWALLMTAAGIGLHILAFALLNIALLLIYENPPASIAALGLAFSMHPLALVFFPFYFFALHKFELNKAFLARTICWCTGAVAVSLPFYLPIFARAGLPYEIIPGQWGYLLTYGWLGLSYDFLFLLPLFVLTVAFGLLQPRYRIASALLGVFLCVNAYVSLRSGPISVFTGAALFPLVFAEELKKKAVLIAVLALFFLPTLLYGIVVMSGTQYWCTWGLTNDMCISPFEYVRDYTPTSSSLALNPIYGHMAAYKARRPVLADLYVEYADEGKWRAENEFYYEANASRISGYGIDYAILDDWYNTPRSVPGDRVYDNGFMHIFLAHR